MATTSVDENFYVTNGSLSGDTITTNGSEVVVKIHTGSIGPVETSYVNEPLAIQFPSVDDPGAGVARTGIKDLLIIKKVITVKGVLAEEDGTASVTKLADLNTLINWGDVVTFVWGKSSASPSEQQTDTGSIIKASVKESPGRVSTEDKVIDATSPDRNFVVDIQFLVGDALRG